MLLGVVSASLACGNDPGELRPDRPLGDEVRVDRALPVAGVADRGRDPAVVALALDDATGVRWCAGVLVRADIVLTARACVARGEEACPASGEDAPLVVADAVSVLLGDAPRAHAPAARGRDIVVGLEPSCALGAAFVVLDRPLPGVRPHVVRSHGVASGDFVRTVTFVPDDEGGLGRVFRDHVPVGTVTADRVTIFEACSLVGGGVALDDDTSEVVGVLAAAGPACGADARNTYARVDALGPVLAEAEARARRPVDLDAGATSARPVDAGRADAGGAGDAGRARVTDVRRPGRGRPASDFGGACVRGADCAAGVCVDARERTYCSRLCAPRDRCPSGYQCRRGVPFDAGPAGDVTACVQK
jgi:hypothetical protein